MGRLEQTPLQACAILKNHVAVAFISTWLIGVNGLKGEANKKTNEGDQTIDLISANRYFQGLVELRNEMIIHRTTLENSQAGWKAHFGS